MGQAPRRRGLHPLGPGKIPLPGLRSFRRGSSPEKGTLPFACSVASALATARGRYHLFPGGGRGVTRLDERPGFSPPFWGWRKRRGACRGGGGGRRPPPPPRGGGGPPPGGGGGGGAPPQKTAAAPAWPPDLPAPPGNSHIADGCRLGMGEAGAVGYAPGRRRFLGGGGGAGGPPAPPTKNPPPGGGAPGGPPRAPKKTPAGGARGGGGFFLGAPPPPPPPPRALGFCTAAPAGKAGREARAFCRPWNGGCRARA